MKNLNLVELNAQELREVEGGKGRYGYWDYSWTNTSNPLIYAGEAVWNLGVLTVNGAAWVGNHLP
ncbi:hypothetical protein BWK59_07160 [Flavobacterium davisii]|uniref:Bacteriocin n=1 Tax=Flavobacterium davisii TaxID=2906077 RepID=A0A246GKB7_9FLAO|nr:hypothetical protein BWK59_07160 [Flavobacterium davisii]